MKKQKSDRTLIAAIYVMCIIQVIYFMVYAYMTRDHETGILSLHALILAMEYFALFAYIATVLKRIMNFAAVSILSLTGENGSSFVSSTFAEIDDAVEEVKKEIERERNINSKKLEMMTMCMETPVAADLFGRCMPMLLEITGSNACAYYYVNNATKKLELMESFGFSEKIYKTFDIEIGEGLEGGCCKSESTRILSEDEKDDKYTYTNAYTKAVYRNVMAVPVKGSDGCVGVVSLAYKKKITNKNIADAEAAAALLAPVHYNNSRYERYRRQKNEIKLQNTLIEDITLELKKKNEEIQALKDKISALEADGE